MERRYDLDDEHQGQDVNQQFPTSADDDASPRPPRSISDLRCRHFGDSMHFIDRLTQISLDLRRVPPMHRQSHLRLRLMELNRRLCRRMATRGRISIDVEDSFEQHQNHRIPAQWCEEHIREDMIRHSVHLPMEPQCVRWPCGGGSTTSAVQNDSEQSTIADFEHPCACSVW